MCIIDTYAKGTFSVTVRSDANYFTVYDGDAIVGTIRRPMYGDRRWIATDLLGHNLALTVGPRSALLVFERRARKAAYRDHLDREAAKAAYEHEFARKNPRRHIDLGPDSDFVPEGMTDEEAAYREHLDREAAKAAYEHEFARKNPKAVARAS